MSQSRQPLDDVFTDDVFVDELSIESVSARGAFTYKEIARRLLKKTRRKQPSPVIRVRNALNMYQYYVDEMSSANDKIPSLRNQCGELIKAKKNFQEIKHKNEEQKQAMQETIYKLDQVIEPLMVNAWNGFIWHGKNKRSIKILLTFIDDIFQLAKFTEHKSEKMLEILELAEKAFDNLYFKKALYYMSKYNKLMENNASDEDKIEELFITITALEIINYRDEGMERLLTQAKVFYETLQTNVEINEINGELVKLYRRSFRYQREGKPLDDLLVEIAELYEALSPLYQGLGETEEQLIVMLTAKACLEKLPKLDKRQQSLHEEIEESIQAIKSDGPSTSISNNKNTF